MKYLRRFITPINVICGFCLLVFSLTIVRPVSSLIRYIFHWNQTDLRMSPDAVLGEFTLWHWERILNSEISEAMLYTPLKNSFAIASTVTLLAFLLGGMIAWLVTSTNIPMKKFIGLAVAVPYIIPSWVKSYAWLIIFNNSKYGVEGLWQYLAGTAPPEWLSHGYFPICIVLLDHYYIFFFLLMSAAFSSINSGLEEAAEIMGANRFTVLRKITLPVMLPAILSGMLLTFLGAFDNFGVTARLGLPVQYFTLGTRIYSSMNNRIFSDAYVFSAILIAISSLFILLNQLLLRKGKRFETVGGRGVHRNLLDLGAAKYPILGVLLVILFLGGVAPLILLLLQSLTVKIGDYSLSNLTLHYWIGQPDLNYAKGLPGALMHDDMLTALFNSVVISAVSAAVCAVLGLLIGYCVAKGRKNLITKLTEFLSFTPYLIPGISLGAMYISIFSKPYGPVPVLYGTLSMLIVITVVKKLPHSSRTGTSNMYRISSELEEAAVLSGANFVTRFLRILLPLSWRGLVNAFMVVLIGAMKELDLVILLATPNTSMLTTLAFEYADGTYPQHANAIISIMIVMLIVIYYLSSKFLKVDFGKGEAS